MSTVISQYIVERLASSCWNVHSSDAVYNAPSAISQICFLSVLFLIGERQQHKISNSKKSYSLTIQLCTVDPSSNRTSCVTHWALSDWLPWRLQQQQPVTWRGWGISEWEQSHWQWWLSGADVSELSHLARRLASSTCLPPRHCATPLAFCNVVLFRVNFSLFTNFSHHHS